MSANRLIANQRLTAAIGSVMNTLPLVSVALKNVTVDAVENEDNTTISVGIRHNDNTLVFNRQWVACQDDDELRYAVLALALFVFYDHAGRRGERDHHLWNMATNYVVNALIDQMIEDGDVPQGFVRMPKDAMRDQRFGSDATSEEVYETLRSERIMILPLDADDIADAGEHKPPILTAEDLEAIREEIRNAVTNPEAK